MVDCQIQHIDAVQYYYDMLVNFTAEIFVMFKPLSGKVGY